MAFPRTNNPKRISYWMKTHIWFYIAFLRQPLCRSSLGLKHEKTAQTIQSRLQFLLPQSQQLDICIIQASSPKDSRLRRYVGYNIIHVPSPNRLSFPNNWLINSTISTSLLLKKTNLSCQNHIHCIYLLFTIFFLFLNYSYQM